MAWVAVHSWAVILLLIYCFMYLPLSVEVLFLSLFWCSCYVSFLFYNRLDEEERAGCFAFIFFLMSCYCKCSVAFPHGAVGWSAICDCGIS